MHFRFVYDPNGLVAAKARATPGQCVFCEEPLRGQQRVLCASMECRRALNSAYVRDRRRGAPSIRASRGMAATQLQEQAALEGRTRLNVHFSKSGRKPLAVSLKGAGKERRIAILVNGDAREATSVYLLCRMPLGLVVGGSLKRELLEAARARLTSKGKSYEILQVRVIGAR